MQRFELRRVEEAIGSQSGQRQEIPDLVRSDADIDIARRTVEGAETERRAAGGLRLIESGLGHDVHDEAALVAVLRRGDAGNDFHRLYRILLKSDSNTAGFAGR